MYNKVALSFRRSFMDSFSAYLIGLAQTDGHLRDGTGKKGSFTIELQYSDLDILQKISHRLECNYSITSRERDTNFKKKYRSVILNVYDLKFREWLKENGMISGKKSDIISPSFSPTDDFAVDYLRGMIDGDGSLGVSGGGRPFFSFVTDSEYLKEF
jgi:intein/homing endonuclease